MSSGIYLCTGIYFFKSALAETAVQRHCETRQFPLVSCLWIQHAYSLLIRKVIESYRISRRQAVIKEEALRQNLEFKISG